VIFGQLIRWSSLKRRSLRNTSNAHAGFAFDEAWESQDKMTVEESRLFKQVVRVMATGFSPAKSTPIIPPV
jgi:hypothetical protein